MVMMVVVKFKRNIGLRAATYAICSTRCTLALLWTVLCAVVIKPNDHSGYSITVHCDRQAFYKHFSCHKIVDLVLNILASI